jgi:hypothetical protein
MSEIKQKKRWFTKHAKSSALMVSLFIHGILLLVAVSFVAVTVIQKEEKKFEYKEVVRPKQPLKRLKVPVKVNKKKPKPKLRKRVVAKKMNRNTPDFQMPEVTGIKGGLGGMGGGGSVESIGFSLPEIDFFGAKAKGEKVVFIVHFGPATIKSGDQNNPFTRMTGFTIRKRLEEMVNRLPEYTLFNVFSYWANDTDAINPTMMLATPDNKQKVMDWMAPVNPLEGEYEHCFSWDWKSKQKIEAAQSKWPTRVDELPFYSMKWAYPYVVPSEVNEKYLPGAPKGYIHWNRAVTGAILTQRPDTIFILTTNYIDAWGSGDNGAPSKILASYRAMFADVYGANKKLWPSVNVVVLSSANAKNADRAHDRLNSQFGPIWKGTNGEGSVIDDISNYMTDDEEALMRKYRSQYGGSQD